MPDKILCPWCGAEMKIKAYEHVWDKNKLHPETEGEKRWNAWSSCMNSGCYAEGPIVSELESEGEAIEAARAAALRRYTPPLKPMTREKLPRRYCLPCWIEEKDGKALPDVLDRDSTGFFGIIDNVHRRNTKYLMFADYGETWRCWERKPTDEERSAAEWKN